jgi:DNA-binding LacI/PurR family transcriptional regulator
MPRKTPSRQKATVLLCHYIEKARSTQQLRLPTISVLAREGQVSPVTMMRAVQKLRQDGVLSVKRGGGIHVCESADSQASFQLPESPKGSQPELKWERLIVRIELDISRGKYRFGSALPSLKELSVGYGVSFRTLKKALREMEDRSNLLPYKRTYQIPILSTSHYSNTVVLIGNIDTFFTPMLYNPRTRDFIRALEDAVTEAGLRLRIVSHREHESSDLNRRRAYTEQLSDWSVLGFLVYPMGITPSDMSILIDSLLRFKKPISVLDESDELNDLSLRAKDNVKLFTVATTERSGYDVGRYLSSLGHRRIACITPFTDLSWSRRRIDGLKRAFKSAGHSNGVQVVAANTARSLTTTVGRALDVEKALVAFGSTFTGNKSAVPSSLTAVMHSMQSQIDLLLKSSYRNQLTHHFESLLRQGDVTAYVGINDDMAFECLDFLQKKGIDVPNEISVIGFDDLMECIIRRLTSYSFNAHGIMRAMLGHVLNPRISKHDAGKSVEIEGIIVERGSTKALDKT